MRKRSKRSLSRSVNRFVNGGPNTTTSDSPPNPRRRIFLKEIGRLGLLVGGTLVASKLLMGCFPKPQTTADRVHKLHPNLFDEKGKVKKYIKAEDYFENPDKYNQKFVQIEIIPDLVLPCHDYRAQGNLDPKLIYGDLAIHGKDQEGNLIIAHGRPYIPRNETFTDLETKINKVKKTNEEIREESKKSNKNMKNVKIALRGIPERKSYNSLSLSIQQVGLSNSFGGYSWHTLSDYPLFDLYNHVLVKTVPGYEKQNSR